MTWFRARAECLAAGGDLWTVGKLDDMYQVARYLKTKAFYWVGATDHAWVYDAGAVGETGARCFLSDSPSPSFYPITCLNNK